VTYHWIAGTVLTASVLFHVIHAPFWLDFWAICQTGKMFSMRGNEFKGFSASQRLRRGGSPSTHAAQGLTNDKGSDSGRLIRIPLSHRQKKAYRLGVNFNHIQ